MDADSPKKQIRLNAFIMNTPVHLSPGLWRHPRDQSVNFCDLHHWLDLARLWERGLFDGVFLADVLGPYDVFGAGPAAEHVAIGGMGSAGGNASG
jgi:alkanesulfonate monooxygenase SsuD/methylene tetrahydromethanopterin reductase-like flavin-dependent oxidoreductase (luciferase family)